MGGKSRHDLYHFAAAHSGVHFIKGLMVFLGQVHLLIHDCSLLLSLLGNIVKRMADIQSTRNSVNGVNNRNKKFALNHKMCYP